MQKIEAHSSEAQSSDLIADNIAKLKALFPELLTEGGSGIEVNVDVLSQLVGKVATDADEKYGLNWHGKRRARQLALTPSTGTLRPCVDESVDWDTTQNLMIEGDNLEVLKLLQKSYAGKVKLIYIDPPYNTGKDFVYSDNFQDNIKNYLELTGQVEGGKKISSNTETSGRFHSDWLNMMYPRLKLARNLLRDDGVILISIDDGEIAHLRSACDEIFGPENFIAQITWEGAFKNDARQIGVSHEYIVLYAKFRAILPGEWSISKIGFEPVLKEVARLKEEFGNDYEAATDALAGWYRANKAKPCFSHRRFRYVDKNGVYKEDDPTAPGGRKFQLVNPITGGIIPLRSNRGWAFDQATFNQLVADSRISFVTSESVMVRRYLHETSSMTPQSVIYQPARSASERLGRLMGAPVFDFPKDEIILSQLIEMTTSLVEDDAIVMDFFAGSGTTGHAVMAQNVTDGLNRRYVLVQLPEPLGSENKEQKAAADYCEQLGRPGTIAELTKERLRRVAKKIKDENPLFAGDTGFRVFKLDTSNIRAWNPDRGDLAQTLLDHEEHLLPGRTETDILYELLLKLGLDLCVPIEKRTIAGKDVHAVGGGVLLACLAEKITRDDVEALSQGIVNWHKELAPAGDTTCLFRDSAFADDVAKSNLAAVLAQYGIGNVRSL